MGLLSGSLSVARFTVAHREAPDFDVAAFREIAPGSEVRESIGFVPFEIGAPWEVGAQRWAFRVRFDRIRPDATAVRERWKQLLASELEISGARFLGAKKRRELKILAQEELAFATSPRTKILEAVIDRGVLYVASSARSQLGLVTTLLRRIGVESAFKAPWVDRGYPDRAGELLASREPSDSPWGTEFLKALVGDSEVPVEPEAGRAKLAFAGTRISLAGEVLADLMAYLERGAEPISLRLSTGDRLFTLDGPSFRLSGAKLLAVQEAHWTELLDARLEQVIELFDLLDRKFGELVKTAD
ncbi:MAG TPA: hypothetical protein VF017_09600 [Thermoanaerobaculia bacterium]|nr:hypothetical protein [Thermoanaerobaculia bacterium]